MCAEKETKVKSVQNPNGPRLCWSEESGVKLMERDGCYFKDLAGDGKFYPYEDWRLSADERARDLASRMTVEQIAGLMLYSKHQFVPGYSLPYFGEVTYEGKTIEESGLPLYALSDQQKQFLEDDFIRHLLIISVNSAADAAKWNNELQSLAETLPWGIPVAISSDPRHGTTVTFEFDAGAGGDISHWPEMLGIAASFDPDLMERFGKIASKEYRGLGITTALSPQIDLCTEPRWKRFAGSIGESSKLGTDLARAYCDGFQTSEGEKEISEGWGYESVNTMVKHWPGGGAVEGGRDAHFGSGKYSVYPGNNFEEHLKPFTEGAFQLKGKTGRASSVMPYYTAVYGEAGNNENAGSSYSKYLITDLLREKYGYDEVVCTDWSITEDAAALESMYGGKCWGAENLTKAERCYKIIMAGVDQFGGLNEKAPVLEAYQIGVKEHGEAFMRARFEQSARRLLRNIFRVGLFENAYLDPEESEKIVGCPQYMEEGFQAQKKSIVMLKNKEQVLPLKKDVKVYVPKIHVPESIDWMYCKTEEHWEDPVSEELLRKYFTITDRPEDADVALCFIRQPDGAVDGLAGGYDVKDKEQGGNGYVPISLQYRPYTAEFAREHSIAQDPKDEFPDRSYRGKTVSVNNEDDLDLVLHMREVMGDKPVIVCVKTLGPLVVGEFEPAADAVLVMFGDFKNAVLEVISGRFNPEGLLPMQLPANMRTVEEQKEDVPFDMECHVDTEGHSYDFGYGMNWQGVIEDERVRKYAVNRRER